MSEQEFKYTQEHEWVALNGNIATVGITQYAVDELGEIVFVELPQIGAEFSQMDEFGTVESVKTVSSLFAPVSGKIVERNEQLESSSHLLNESPYLEGWLIKLEMSDLSECDDLMTHDEYKTYLETL